MSGACLHSREWWQCHVLDAGYWSESSPPGPGGDRTWVGRCRFDRLNRDDDEEYIKRLVGQVIHVSLETMKIVNHLPDLGLP
jgi:hypothetical protein